MEPLQPCPCGTGRSYAECCGPFHQGAPAPTAVALMRSRYSAYALGLHRYLLATWDPRTRPQRIDLENDLTWRRLQIVDTSDGGGDAAEGTVWFRASYRTAEGVRILEERSRFRRHDGQWRYVDGEQLEN
jgi:SEC-C motif-containing protein